MKKSLLWLICAGLVLAACAAPGRASASIIANAAVPTPKPSAAADATPEPAATDDVAKLEAETEAGLASHTPAYGEPLLLEADQEGFSGTIVYPSGFEALDNALEKWASETMKAYETKAQAETANAEGMKGELYVTYNSYEVTDRFVSVQEAGYYAPANGTGGEAVAYTANYDTKTSKLLTLTDVVDKDQLDKVGTLIYQKLEAAGKTELLAGATAVKADLMQRFFLTQEGVGFLFTNGGESYACLLTYNEVIDSLALFADQPATPTPAPTEAEKLEIVEKAVCNHNGAHVRSEASADAGALAVIQAGAELEVTKQDAGNGFTQIWYNEGPAYVRTAYLSFAETPQAAGDLSAAETGYVTGKGVHVRAGAGTRYKKLGTLQYGDQVEIVTPYYTDNWHQILFEGQIAYISARYISVGNMPAVTPKPAQVSPSVVSGRPRIEFVGTCTTNGVIIRSTPSVKADYYGKLYSGNEVQVMESEYRSGWDKVWIPTNNANTKGYVGYVHSKYIQDWSQVVPVVQATANPVIPVVQATPLPVITSGPAIGTGAGYDPPIGSGVTLNP